MQLTLIRHGATEWNASRRFQGHTDVPLSGEGREQAHRLSERLAHEHFDAFFASDLVRAMETARIVAAPHALEVAAEPRLREFDFGDWEGLTWPQIVATRPHLEDGARTAAALYAPDGGETFEAVCARVGSFFADLRANPAGHVAVVMHAGPLHAALAVLGLVPQAADGSTLAANFAPASLTRIAMEAGRSRLITLSDVRHLHTAG